MISRGIHSWIFRRKRSREKPKNKSLRGSRKTHIFRHIHCIKNHQFTPTTKFLRDNLLNGFRARDECHITLVAGNRFVRKLYSSALRPNYQTATRWPNKVQQSKMDFVESGFYQFLRRVFQLGPKVVPLITITFFLQRTFRNTEWVRWTGILRPIF